MAVDREYTAAEVASRLAIEQVIARYVHAIDDRDYDTLDDVFTPDAKFDLSAAGGISGSWAADIKPWYAENLGVFENYFHTFMNIRVTLDEDGAGASTKSKVINPCGIRGEDGELHHFEIVGSYDDRWRKTTDGWRISERTWNHGWIWGDYPQAGLPAGDF
ncbi:nuclear transport factor 2 family protein [Pseudonocardia halophobica]|uniref:nuclear transport factor 2 family protein n=1 Tax=Pseudonocardia halophobica TaxID=29401 RepID=UPI003D91F6DE